MKHRINKLLLAMFIFLIALGFASCAFEVPVESVDQIILGEVVISEVSAANATTVEDMNGEYWDWIELHNTTDREITLTNYALSDNESNFRKYIIPDGVIIAPNQYLLVFCSGLDKFENGELHTNFKISSDGESIMLSNNSEGTVISRIDYVKCVDDTSMGTDEVTGNVVFYSKPTPSAQNNIEYYNDVNSLVKAKYTVYINECSSDNNGIVLDKDGEAPDWMELYNYGEEAVNLSGMYLSDNDTALKWQFPDNVQIEPKQYMTVMLSGKDYDYTNGELHCDFGLGNEDKMLTLFSPIITIVDSMEITSMRRGVSMGKTASGGIAYYLEPTPGKVNDTKEYSSLEDATRLSVRGLWISEVMAISCSRNDVCDWDNDWIEIYNGTDTAISLNGYGLSDSKEDLFRFTFSNTTINPGEYIVVTLNGVDNPSNLTAGFKLSNSGETLYITSPDGTVIDDFAYGRQVKNVTSGRYGTESDERVYFKTPTMGEANPAGVKNYTPLPEFSIDEVYVNAGDTVSLSADGDYTIYYTTDGTKPTAASQIYSSPITINKSMIIKAACFADDAISGGVVSHTYVTEEKHDIPVVCVSSDPDGLFGYNRGIFADGPGISNITPFYGANFWNDWEREIHFEYYETDGTKGIDFGAGLRVFGAFSRANAQKSMSVHLREAYGNSSVTYPFFENNEVKEFSDFLLRSGGQDCYMSKLRDGLFAKIVEGQMDIDFMDYKPVAVYMNGEYYGLYNLREKVNENYFYNHGTISTEEVDIIKTNYVVQSGTRKNYAELLNFARTHDLSIKENYEYICSQVDIQEMINYYMIVTFFVNSDSGNIKVYKGYGEEDKWRWVMFDMDMSLFTKSYQWNMIEELFMANSGFYDTTLLRALIKNPEFKQLFIETYAHHLNTTFAPERTSKILRELAANIESEIPRQAKRWGAPTLDFWQRQIDTIEQRMAERVTLSKQYLRSCFNLSNSEMQELFPN